MNPAWMPNDPANLRLHTIENFDVLISLLYMT
jgi:hypothetical protein